MHLVTQIYFVTKKPSYKQHQKVLAEKSKKYDIKFQTGPTGSHVCCACIYFLGYSSAHRLNGDLNSRKSVANYQSLQNPNFTPF